MKSPPLVAMVMTVSILSTACKCSPTGPSGPSMTVNGTVAGGGVVFHDFAPPSGTDSVNIEVRWTPSGTELRLIQIDPNCDPTQADCRRVTDPTGPRPDNPTLIIGYGNNQGLDAGPRLRFMIQNITADREATYTMLMTPRRHGCER